MSEAKKFWRDPQNIIAIGVTFISVCALVVSIQQTRIMSEQRELMHEHAKAEVWPRLEFGISKGHYESDGSLKHFRILVSNEGVGPAIVKGVQMRYQGEVVSDWWALFKQLDLPNTVSTYIGNATVNNSIIRPGAAVEMLDLEGNMPLANQIFPHLPEIEIDIYYESIYGDCWQLEVGTDDMATHPFDSAAIPEEQTEI